MVAAFLAAAAACAIFTESSPDFVFIAFIVVAVSSVEAIKPSLYSCSNAANCVLCSDL